MIDEDMAFGREGRCTTIRFYEFDMVKRAPSWDWK